MISGENKVWLAIICITHVINGIVKRRNKICLPVWKITVAMSLSKHWMSLLFHRTEIKEAFVQHENFRSENIAWIVVSCTINIALIITFLILAGSLWFSLCYTLLSSLCKLQELIHSADHVLTHCSKKQVEDLKAKQQAIMTSWKALKSKVELRKKLLEQAYKLYQFQARVSIFTFHPLGHRGKLPSVCVNHRCTSKLQSLM